MSNTDTLALVSSAATVHAERLLIASDLEPLFKRVIRSPEESVGGSESKQYLTDAGKADCVVVLLTQESRSAVAMEVKAALAAGAHVEAFALHYPPYKTVEGAWVATPEERLIRDHGIFVRPVVNIIDLRRDVKLSIGQMLSRAIHRYHQANASENYLTACRWLQLPGIERVALAQSTSMLLLGARRSRPDEAEALQMFTDLLNRARSARGKRIQFMHVFDVEKTQLEARGHLGDYSHQQSARSILRGYAPQRWKHVHISGVPLDTPLAHVLLVNNHVGLGTPLGVGGGFVSIIEDKKTADKVWQWLAENPRTAVSDMTDEIEGLALL